MAIKLTQTVSCGGCAAKINPTDLFAILNKLPVTNSNKLAVDFSTGDDACVYYQDDENAIIFTTDFIAPIVDDPYDFGRIAATNALSDIYAMGGKPLLALNIACFNPDLGNEVLESILLGSASVCKQTNTILCGGHTVKSNEIRYGLAVIGSVNPKEIITNSNGKKGDKLYLTKPLGTGILSQALKNNILTEELTKTLTNCLCETNEKVSEVMRKIGITCATDVTGFGLLGHLLTLLQSSNCGAEIFLDKLPYLPKTLEYANSNNYSGNLSKNEEYVKEFISGNYQLHKNSKLLFDPQTSGGMLICVEESKVEIFEKEMQNNNLSFYQLGNLIESKHNIINLK